MDSVSSPSMTITTSPGITYIKKKSMVTISHSVMTSQISRLMTYLCIWPTPQSKLGLPALPTTAYLSLSNPTSYALTS